jgi:flagellar basal-body rod protein FlgF
MDRFLYVAMTGASELQLAQAVTNNNLANASTTGFKATLASALYVPIEGPGHEDARVYSMTAGEGIDFTPGGIVQTGRELDVAVDGDGWFAVQAPDGSEAYTRAGDFRIDAYGLLTTSTGEPVLGEGGPIAISQYQSIEIGRDGTISIRPLGQEASVLSVVDRIRLVSIPQSDLVRGTDGLMRVVEGGTAAVPDASVKLVSRSLESSNVNIVSAMVEMITQARAYEMQIKMLGTAESIDQASQQLIALT